MTEQFNRTSHYEWLRQIDGTAISEITTAIAMPGFEYIPRQALVVGSANSIPKDKIRQNLVPLAVTEDDSGFVKKAKTESRMLRATLLDDDVMIILFKDEDIADSDMWVLSLLCPKYLSQTPIELYEQMEAFYSIGDVVTGSALRTAYLAITGLARLGEPPT